MIEKITSSQNSNHARSNKANKNQQNPNFKGLGALAISGLQACERMPMVNVAVIDLLSAILPRTIVESMTNWFAGFEALRRESSGLIVNCLIPSAIACGIAMGVNRFFMPKGSNLSKCWADSSLIDKLAHSYNEVEGENKVEGTIKDILSNIEGVDGKDRKVFKDILTEEEINNYAKELTEISKKEKNGKEVDKIAKQITDKTHIAENIKIGGKKEVAAQSVNSMLSDTVKFMRQYQNQIVENGKEKLPIEEFAKQAKKLVKTKSLVGLAVVLPLAASMQYINRWITGKLSGVKGAPIYDDYAKNKDNIEENPKAKEGLFKQKLISISSMIGVSLLSMMKMPSMKMLEFKGIFPSMDQARIISTCTFASRMAAADDKNELREATVRDIATFMSLYFLGDYAAKGFATIMQKKTGITLLNDMKPLENDEKVNIFKKIKHWVKDVNIKSSEELVTKKAKNLRSACQAANLGVSLLLLGLVIPIFTRKNTQKKHAEALRLAKHNADAVSLNDNTNTSSDKDSLKVQQSK